MFQPGCYLRDGPESIVEKKKKKHETEQSTIYFYFYK